MGLLKRGSKGNATELLQNILNQIMDSGLDEDGIFGKGTEEAVKAFQNEVRNNPASPYHDPELEVDGLVGPNTANVLTKALGMLTGQNLNTDELVG